MRLKDLNTLPKVRDSLSYLYVEPCKIEQDAKGIAFFDKDGKTSVPCANLTTLLVGPGTTIKHSAVKTRADNGCLVMWSGKGAVRFYAAGMGETRAARHLLLRQAYLSSIPQLRLRVVRRMYEMRFGEELPKELILQQIRGKEDVRAHHTSQSSAQTGVEWTGRSYNRADWKDSTPINRALSAAANSSLYGVCQAAIVSAGYSTALGFIHTGKMLSFFYDIADLAF